MFPSHVLLDRYLSEAFLRKPYAKGLYIFLDRMIERDLEATRIEDDGDGSVRIVWENGFNKTHVVHVTFFFFGPVVGEAMDSADPTFEKMWVVSDLSKPNERRDMLELTIDETLEYIRHFIWANHTV
jgi:hypothetical protein